MLAWLKRTAGSNPRQTSTSPNAVVSAADAARERGDHVNALRLYSQAHAAAPNHLYTLYWLATLMQEAGQLEEAWHFGELGLEIDADQIGLLARMASIAHDRLDPVAALELYQRVATLAPEFPEVDAHLADQLCFLGRLDEGIAAFERAIARSAEPVKVEQSRLFCLNFSENITAQALAHEHRAWAAKYCRRESRAATSFERRHAGEPLHIAYVSPDLRNHAIAYFMTPLLAHHNRARVKVSVFDTSNAAEDAMTAKMRVHVDHWHKVADLADAALADAIRASGVDVLFDLSGHTRGNRLFAFAERAAPVQVSWLGYLATTGVPAMDFRLTDGAMDPPGMTESLHTERLVRLPVQACFSPLADSPEVNPPPSQMGAPITFGSVNQWAKVSDSTKDLWASILVERRAARLFVVARGAQNPKLREHIAGEFVRRGAQARQIEVFPFGSTMEFLRFLGRIDIALDPFPYGGGTTTMQCLWMGVPVVTLAGRTPMSRNSVGPLVQVGLADLIAPTSDAYRHAAIGLADDGPRLARLRGTLREAMAASPLMDAAAFARSVEDACRQMRDNVASATRE